MYKLNQLDIRQFLSDHWQQQPCLIEQGFSQFVDPLEANELAGIAMEQEAEARIVRQQNGQHLTLHGPFDDFSDLPATDWTLLVQSVDYWCPAAQQLLNCFRFIPDWRIDDLMVSYSVPGGGVGRHQDQYDVFIIQGTGKRRWRVFDQQGNTIIDHLMQTGDIVYIPPGFDHQSETIESCLNYSVGFRAPNQRELMSSYADYLLDRDVGDNRFSDLGRQQISTASELSAADSEQLQRLLIDSIQDKQCWRDFIGYHFSQARQPIDSDENLDISLQELTSMLSEGLTIAKSPGLRLVTQHTDNNIRFDIDGQHIDCPAGCQRALLELCNRDESYIYIENPSNENRQWRQLLTKLINCHLWVIQ